MRPTIVLENTNYDTIPVFEIEEDFRTRADTKAIKVHWEDIEFVRWVVVVRVSTSGGTSLARWGTGSIGRAGGIKNLAVISECDSGKHSSEDCVT